MRFSNLPPDVPDVRLGSAASPRWFDLSRERLDDFIDALVEWGATATELVLHAGEADEQTARVHILESDWDEVSRRFQRRGVVCHAHAPLSARFKLDRWTDDRTGLQAAFRPVLEAVNRFSARQPEPSVLVLHAPSGPPESAARAAREFALWAAERLEATGASLAFELRRPVGRGDRRFDRGREQLAAFVAAIGHERIGICWDVAHDWQSSATDPDWTAEPEAAFLRRVCHVHVHGAGVFEGAGDVHFPLQSGTVPWRRMLSPLIAAGYHGAVTIEARYRYARAVGEPWPVLRESFRLLQDWLTERGADQPA